MKKNLIVFAALLLTGCIKLDFFLFEAEKATSIEGDYHGLPLSQGEETPAWLDEGSIEREIYLRIPDGTEIPPSELSETPEYLHGVFLPAPAECPASQCPLIDQNITFLYQHGNSGHLWRYWYRAVALWNMGANVFIYTYRGYGLSKGEATTAHVLEDAETTLTYVISRPDYTPETRLIAYGYSMGAIPTSYLTGTSAKKAYLDGTILESGLDSPESILQLSLGVSFPAGYFFEGDDFDGPEYIRGLPEHLPVLHIHGGKDTRVIMAQAERYYDVLETHPEYTHYIGKTDKTHEDWVALAGHRNVPDATFKAELHLADYWDDPSNPGHCCVHPDEYLEPGNQEFLAEIGDTDGESMADAAEKYQDLIVSWVLEAL